MNLMRCFMLLLYMASYLLKGISAFCTLPMASSCKKKLSILDMSMEPNAVKTLAPQLVDLSDSNQVREEHYFSDEANWLIPGSVLLGRYPANDPYITCTKKEQRRKLEKIIVEGGVTTFICLQAELPPQTETGLRDGPQWDEDGEMPSGHRRLGGTFTRYQPDAESLFQKRKRRNPTDKNLQFLHLPIADLSPAKSMDLLRDYILQVKERVLEQEEVLYIHCWGGCGRTGLISSCLLGEIYGCSSDEALERVDTYFKLRSSLALAPHNRSPETEAQISQVRKYYQEFLPDTPITSG